MEERSSVFGFDHPRHLRLSGLYELSDILGLKYAPRAQIAEVLPPIERHFAKVRKRNGTANREFMDPNFHPGRWTIPKIRQLLSEHDIAYVYGSYKHEFVQYCEYYLPDIRAQYTQDSTGSVPRKGAGKRDSRSTAAALLTPPNTPPRPIVPPALQPAPVARSCVGDNSGANDLIVDSDEDDGGSDALSNFDHGFGHCICNPKSFVVTAAESIGIPGMYITSFEDLVLRRLRLPLSTPSVQTEGDGCTWDFYRCMLHDQPREQCGRNIRADITLHALEVLLRAAGNNALVGNDLENDVAKALFEGSCHKRLDTPATRLELASRICDSIMEWRGDNAYSSAGEHEGESTLLDHCADLETKLHQGAARDIMLRATLEGRGSDLVRLQGQIKTLEEQGRRWQEQNVRLRTDQQDLKAEHSRFKILQHAHRHQIDRLGEQILALQSQNENLEEQLQDITTRFTTVSARLRKVEADSAELQWLLDAPFPDGNTDHLSLTPSRHFSPFMKRYWRRLWRVPPSFGRLPAVRKCFYLFCAKRIASCVRPRLISTYEWYAQLILASCPLRLRHIMSLLGNNGHLFRQIVKYATRTELDPLLPLAHHLGESYSLSATCPTGSGDLIAIQAPDLHPV